MNASVTPAMRVQDALNLGFQVVQVFTRHHMDCVGCWMQRFCTLEYAAASYAFPINDLLEEIRQVLPSAQRRES